MMGVDGLLQAQRALAEAEASAAADQPLLQYAGRLAEEERDERRINHWALRVQAAWQAQRGTA